MKGAIHLSLGAGGKLLADGYLVRDVHPLRVPEGYGASRDSGLVKLIVDDGMCYIISKETYEYTINPRRTEPDPVWAAVECDYQQWSYTYCWELWRGQDLFVLVSVGGDHFEAVRRMQADETFKAHPYYAVLCDWIEHTPARMLCRVVGARLTGKHTAFYEGRIPNEENRSEV